MNNREPIIVVVDPDSDRATALSARLDRSGYYVVRRSSGIDSIECVAECRPDLVLSEIELPDIERPELLHSIHEISPSTRVLFVNRLGRSPQLAQEKEDNSLEPVETGRADQVVQVVDRLLESR